MSGGDDVNRTRDEAREGGGAWEGGYGSSAGFNTDLLEWFETRIRQPIESLDDSVADLTRKVDNHLEWSMSNSKAIREEILAHVKDDHLTWVAQRRTAEKWIRRGLAGSVPLIIATVLQLSGKGF